MRNVGNLCAFQIGWLACALGAAHRHPYIGPVVVAALIAGHLALATSRAGELRFILTVALLGTLVDSLHLRLGVVEFHEPLTFGILCPLWMIALWANFATTLHYSLAWLDRRPYLAAVFGAIGGPLSYWAGDRWYALSLGGAGPVTTHRALLVLAATWGLVTPLLFRLARVPYLGGSGESPGEDLSI